MHQKEPNPQTLRTSIYFYTCKPTFIGGIISRLASDKLVSDD